MQLRSFFALLLATSSGFAAAFPTQTAIPSQALVPGPDPTPALELRAAAPSFTGVSITPVSIKSFSLSLDLPSSTCTQTIEPDRNGYVPPGTCGALWAYYPSFAAAVAFAVLFGALLIAHLGQAILYKKGFCWVITMASLWEFGSYGFRAAGSKNQQSNALATLAQILVLLAPIWVNAFAYMVFARIVHFFSPTKKVWKISPSILAFVFVTLDVLSFIIQLIGGGMAGPGSSPESQKKGIDIYMAGIGLQEAFIIFFLGLVIKFHFDQIRAEKNGRLAASRTRWKWITYALYACLAFITARIVFRLVEFSGGMDTDNPLPHNESYFYALEAVPMFLAILVWNLIHPGRYMNGPDAKLPPSWLSRKLCCCFHRKGKDGKGSHQRLNSTTADEEMKALRSRDPSPNPRGRTGEAAAFYYDAPSRGTSATRDPSMPAAPQRAGRDDSANPPSYEPYRPREFLGPQS
ncbi:uncharacterized protein HMPREF1541_03030 [Cyphellophora europaea CBS 101466]|uniref:RTA1 domain-containing protein n=1 Tax=Cyphellophora europaea (strain CBS 101466) TaxID=1220924 RepID=W2RXP5_CYPE1|nr:uncharacterized protein HMPREF1541_03030 [Cyphellophora europaea CBS 101466]ETN41095.1 hypothetical protein HMPREF1541_03030 [Cyphellophora europaea CBS 101466]